MTEQSNNSKENAMTYEQRVEQLAEGRNVTKLAPRDAITSRGGVQALKIKGEPEVLWCDVWDRIQERRAV